MSSTRTIRPPRGAALTLCLSALLLAAFGVAITSVGAVDRVDPVDPARATAAIDWLAGELDSNGGTLPGFTPGSTDWGVTADAVLTHVAAGRGGDASAQAATDQLSGALPAYTTFEPDIAGVRVAGATAKVLLVLISQGRDTSDIGSVGGTGGVDLEAELRSLMGTTVEHAGRFADRVPDPTWDASNGFGQALSVLALARTTGGVPAEAVAYLMTQQCPAGGFRLSYPPLAGPAVGCTTDPSADGDSTALAVQALLATTRTPTSDAALARAVAWLIARQDPSTGGFGGSGPTSAVNANSTGVIAQALRAAGQIDAADRAAQWITSSLQLGTGESAGAIGYNAAASAAASANGISAGVADQWRRATSQAALALGLAPYSPVIGPPVVLTSTTVPASTPPTSTPSASTPLTSTTVPASTPPISVLPATVVPGGVVRGSGLSGATGAQSGSITGRSASSAGRANPASGAVSAGTRLASTGSRSTLPLRLGLGLTTLGCTLAVAAGAATRRKVRT